MNQYLYLFVKYLQSLLNIFLCLFNDIVNVLIYESFRNNYFKFYNKQTI